MNRLSQLLLTAAAFAATLPCAAVAVRADATPLPSPISLPLWPGNPPNWVPGSGPGADDGTGRWRNVGVPGMLVYLPRGKPENQKRIAIIACPGGGYTHLTRLEGADGAVASFAPKGVVVVSLKYRLKPPSTNIEPDTLADVKRAVRLLRAHAAEWGIDPHRIGVLGWSAGANLGLNLTSHFDKGDPSAADPIDRQSSRPDFVVLLSPWPDGNTPDAYPIGKNAPPAFLGTARDDKTAPPTFAEAVARNFRAAGVPCEFIEVPTGGHGAHTINAPGPGGRWPDRFWNWLAAIGMRKGE